MKSLVEVGDVSKTSNILQRIGEEVFHQKSSRSRFALNLSPTNHQTALSQLKDFINQGFQSYFYKLISHLETLFSWLIIQSATWN